MTVLLLKMLGISRSRYLKVLKKNTIKTIEQYSVDNSRGFFSVQIIQKETLKFLLGNNCPFSCHFNGFV